MTQEDTEKEDPLNGLYDLWEEYQKAVKAEVDNIAEKLVYPFLQKRGYLLIAGNGGYYLEDDQNGTQLPNYFEAHEDPFDGQDEEFRSVLAAMNASIPGFRLNTVGSLMNDYHPTRMTE